MNEKQTAIIRELREMAKDLPKGKARKINNYLDYVTLALRQGTASSQIPTAYEPTEEEAVEFERQWRTVYDYLQDGNTITSKQSFDKWGITRLSARIKDIEKKTGIAPSRRRIKVMNRNGREVSVCEYWMEQGE